MNDFRVAFKDIQRYYMLQKPMGRTKSDEEFYFFIICLEKPVRQGQSSYPYLVWQCHNEEVDLTLDLEEAEIEERFPGAALSPTVTGPLHKLIGKLFKVFTGKTVFAGSKKFRSSAGDQCVGCSYGQNNCLLYPNDKSFIILHKPTLVVEYSDVDYVEFVKEQGTKNFELLVVSKKKGGEAGKKHRFGSIEKKEMNGIAAFLGEKTAYFELRNFQAEAEPEDDEDEDESDADFSGGGSEVRPGKGFGCNDS